jgi:hypothetical protein
MPVAATVSRALSLHLLATNRNNVICLYHQRHRHAKFRDGFHNEKYLLVGVPYAKFVGTSKEEDKAQPPAGYLHCGCDANVALLDFFWWKTWSLKSMRPGLIVSEGMKDEVMHPRVRAFVAQAFTMATGLTVDDLYTSGVGAHGYDSKPMRRFQLDKMLGLVNEWNLLEASPALTIA